MKLDYIIKKIYNKLEVRKLKKFAVDDNLFLVNENDKKIKSVMFYFPNYQMMHFGDHLFFEPLARELKSLGYDVYIYPIKAMEFYFKKLGFFMATESMKKNMDLILTPVSFISDFIKTDFQVLFIDTTNTKIQNPLCDDLIQKVFKFLKVEKTYTAIPSNIDVKSDFLDSVIDNDTKYILFNNYLDSGSFRTGVKDQNKIIKFAEVFKKNKNYKIIHTGSQQDKDKDNNEYNFIDIDLRGKTSIEEMFYLCSQNNILYNISFDAFQMHLFFINQKKSYILFRGRYLKKNENYIKDFVNPPFKYKNVPELIEYIE